MNERIEKLADECWSKSEYDPSIDPWFNHRKFAELIVRECAEFTHPVTRKFIFEHFGVEE